MILQEAEYIASLERYNENLKKGYQFYQTSAYTFAAITFVLAVLILTGSACP